MNKQEEGRARVIATGYSYIPSGGLKAPAPKPVVAAPREREIQKPLIAEPE